MLLVPHELVGENESISKYLTHLDREMLAILKNESLPDYAAISLICKTLFSHVKSFFLQRS